MAVFFVTGLLALQYSCLENPMDGGAWWAAVHEVAKSLDTTQRLHFHFSLSCVGEGNGNPPLCSCLENPRDGGAWWAAVYGVAQSRTRLKRLSSSSLCSTTLVMQAAERKGARRPRPLTLLKMPIRLCLHSIGQYEIIQLHLVQEEAAKCSVYSAQPCAQLK